MRKKPEINSRFRRWLYRFIPMHVSGRIVLGALSLLAQKGIGKKKIQKQYQHNEKVWKNVKSDEMTGNYIEEQHSLSKILYGSRTADYNACEIIAVYNALVFMGEGESMYSFPWLLSWFSKRGICLHGEFGTSPKAVALFFKNQGFEVKLYQKKNVNKNTMVYLQEHYETFIGVMYNDKDDLGAQIHTVSITKHMQENKNSYFVHNANMNIAYSSLAEAIEKYRNGTGACLCIMGIRKEEQD